MPRVVVPWRPGCAHRARAWEWLKDQWPWPTVEAPGPDPWCKARAVIPAVAACRPGEIVVVADADVLTDTTEAVRAVQEGAAWAIPHKSVHRLTQESTVRLIAGEPWRRLPTIERPYRGVTGGGVIVARRETLLDIPMDPRFVGWGQEDEAWGLALTGLLGPPWRGRGHLVHLFHPPQPRQSRARGSRTSWQLRRRYWQARNDPAATRALIEEAKRDLQSHHQAVHDHAPAAV